MKTIQTSEIVKGMILSKDIFSHENVLFLSRGSILNEEHRKTLISLGIKYIDIFTDPEGNPFPEASRKNQEMLREKQFEKTYWEAVDTTEAILNRLTRTRKFDEKEMVNTIQNLIPLTLTAGTNLLNLLHKIKNRNESIFTHLIGVSIFSIMIGKWLNKDEPRLIELGMAGIIHDLGKCQIPSIILNKPGPLSLKDYQHVQKHSLYGFQLALESNIRKTSILSAILQHHERVDGSGYPYGITANHIDETAKIVMVADIFEALLANRPYRQPVNPFYAVEEIKAMAYNKLDPLIATTFIYRIADYFIGSSVALNNGEVGEVISLDRLQPSAPMVRVQDRIYDLRLEPNLKIIKDVVPPKG
ncbi:MAG: HD-GYP domain-containing protein [Syntrophomonadaceae bacterium]|nr:HD-GYP domain-containing protein [Syntrophomonadaceae bacterium]